MEEDRYQSHLKFFARAKKLLGGAVCRRFDYTYDVIGAEYEPYLILANHNTDLDPGFIGIAVERHTYFVATENVMRKKLIAKFLMRYLQPIIHFKGKLGMVSTKNILKTLKEGKSVAMFAEGNRSFNGVTGYIAPATIKLAQKCGANVVTYRLEGGYFTQPRWGKGFRRGKMTGKLVHVYTPEELKAMSTEEAYEKLTSDLYEDAYATQERETVHFKGMNAEGLETTLFMCPECRIFSALHSHKDHITCSECGFDAVIDDTGYLVNDMGRYTITELDALQKESLEERASSADPSELLFTDEIDLWKIEDHQIVSKRPGKLTGFAGGFMLDDRYFRTSDIEGVALFARNTINVTMSDGQYEIHGSDSFSALKYYYLYRYLSDRTE